MNMRTNRFKIGQLGGKLALPAVAVLLVIGFSAALPSTFATSATWTSILDAQGVTALLALGLTLVVAVGEFDLSVGYGVGLMHILAVGLIVQQGLPWPVAAIAVIGAGLLLGLINGVLVQFVNINSFIATLGTGTLAYAVANWYTGGNQITGNLPSGFTSIFFGSVFGVPAPLVYIAGLLLVVWLALEYTPTGRYMYALGANRQAAQLARIPVKRYVVGSFVAAGGITGLSGVILASQLQVGDVSVGPDYLLPVFTAAMLGSTTIRPGRANPLGTIIAIATLGIGVAGIDQLGAGYWITPLFDGATLIIGVGVAVNTAQRVRRGTSTASPEEGDRGEGGADGQKLTEPDIAVLSSSPTTQQQQ
jgi:ribose transport system permease protein